MNKNKIITAVFIILLASSLILLLMPADTESFKNENRTISNMPQFSKSGFLSGEFASDFESFIDDNIAFRSAFTKASQTISSYKGITPPDGKIVYTNKDIGTETVQKACLLIVDGKMMEVFRKNISALQKYAQAINHISENIDTDIDIYSMLVPTQLEFMAPIYKNIQDSQENAINEIYSMLNPRIRTIDVLTPLKNHSDEYIFFRTDHHWTMLGAYYGYSAFMKAQGLAPVSKSNFDRYEIEDFKGLLYEQHPDDSVIADTIEWYDTEKPADLSLTMISINNGKENVYSCPMFDKNETGYTFFFSSDHPYTLIKNKEINNGKTLLIIKDSFANDFVPWCVNNYEQIIMVDPRTYKDNLRKVFQNNDIDDVLILNYIFTTSFEDYCDKMINMFK